MHGFGFFPGAFLFVPLLAFFFFLRIALVVLVVVLVVRLVTHGRRHGSYGYVYGPGHGHGSSGPGFHDADPRRIAAWRYSAGKIDRAEYENIVAALGAAAPSAPAAPHGGPASQA